MLVNPDVILSIKIYISFHFVLQIVLYVHGLLWKKLHVLMEGYQYYQEHIKDNYLNMIIRIGEVSKQLTVYFMCIHNV